MSSEIRHLGETAILVALAPNARLSQRTPHLVLGPEEAPGQVQIGALGTDLNVGDESIAKPTSLRPPPSPFESSSSFLYIDVQWVCSVDSSGH